MTASSFLPFISLTQKHIKDIRSQKLIRLSTLLRHHYTLTKACSKYMFLKIHN